MKHIKLRGYFIKTHHVKRLTAHKFNFKPTGEGQLATVELTEVEGGENVPQAGELADTLCDHYIDFGILYPYTYMEKSFTVTNKT